MVALTLKTMIETDKFIIQDFDIIAELSTYILQGKEKYEAEDGSTDDLVMCLVMFCWLSNQTYFKELTGQDIRARLVDEQSHLMEQDMAAFGFVDDGLQEQRFKDRGTWSCRSEKRLVNLVFYKYCRR